MAAILTIITIVVKHALTRHASACKSGGFGQVIIVNMAVWIVGFGGVRPGTPKPDMQALACRV